MGSYNVDRERDLSGPTELLVHGVGGESAESLLGAEAVLVAGDDLSGFYRARHRAQRDPSGDDAHSEDERRLEIREAYSWGGLTSGGGFLTRLKKSLWVLLLPFSLVNTAGWMAPPADDPEGTSDDAAAEHPGGNSLRARIVRLLGLWMTMAFGLWLAAIFVDMAALQCGAVTDCAAGQSWLKWLNWDFFQFIQGRPVALMAVGLSVPLLGLAIAWVIGHVSQRSSEGRLYAVASAFGDEVQDESDGTSGDHAAQRSQTEVGPSADITGEDMTQTELARGDLWHSKHRVGSLLRVHLAASLGAIAAAFAFTVFWLESQEGEFAALYLVLMIAALVFTGGVAAWGAWPGGTRDGRRAWHLLIAGALLLVVIVALGWFTAPEFSRIGDQIDGRPTLIQIRDRFNESALGIGLAPIFVLLVALFWLVWRAPYNTKDRTRMGQAVAAGLGVVAGGPVLAGGALWLGDTLQLVEISRFYKAAAVAQLIVGLFIGGLIVANVWRLARERKRQAGLEKLSSDLWARIVASGTIERAKLRFPEELAQLSNEQIRARWESHEQFSKWRSGIMRRLLISKWTRKRAMKTTITMVGVLVALTGWGVIDIAMGGGAGFQDRLTRWSWSITVAKWAMLVMFALLLRVAYRSYQDHETRRNVARVWDVLTFWPRWFHPLAPPSYAVSAVPQLRTHLRRRHRLEWPKKADEKDENRVLLSAHSQGTVLAVALVARLDDRTRSRIALLTYGSPIRSLYSWFFPRFFSRTEMETIAASLGGRPIAEPNSEFGEGYPRWRNLRRCSDPIGSTIFTESDPEGNEACLELAAIRQTHSDGSTRLNNVDWIIPDPFPELPAAGDPMPDAKGHSNYDADAPFESARNELFAALGVDPTRVGSGGDDDPDITITVDQRRSASIP